MRRVAFRVPVERAEEARALMLELFPEGFEERDGDGELELAGYTSAVGEDRFRQAAAGVTATRVEPGWEQAWKRFHRPVRVGPLWIGPPWERPSAGTLAVVLDPGRAFGTGAHPTTRLCLELLVRAERTSLADFGCGSGVLAIAAVKLGFAPVLALDMDEAAVSAARANAVANGVSIEVRRCDVLTDELPAAELGVANIGLPEIARVGGRFPGRRLITSGYLASERPHVPGWRGARRLEQDGWAADLLERF